LSCIFVVEVTEVVNSDEVLVGTLGDDIHLDVSSHTSGLEVSAESRGERNLLSCGDVEREEVLGGVISLVLDKSLD